MLIEYLCLLASSKHLSPAWRKKYRNIVLKGNKDGLKVN